MRLDRFLSNQGFGSRSEVQRYIRQGLVKVNGQVVKEFSFKIDPLKDSIFFEDEQVSYSENYYFMLNKPAGYITATMDDSEPTVLELFSDFPLLDKLFPIGRLDKDTEGLLILTTDGQFAHRISHPKWNVNKEYYVKVEGDVSKIDFREFERKGVYLRSDRYQTKPFKVFILTSSDHYSELFITVSEGKYHIVKKIMAQLDHPVLYLKRVRVGNLRLDDSLEPGEYRELTEEEIKELKGSVKL